MADYHDRRLHENITGFYLSFHQPGYLSVMRCLLHAVRPKYKASIERWFGTQNRRLLHELPGTTFSNVIDRDEYDPQKHAVISIDACLELAHLWIVDTYHQTVHRGVRDIPHRRWVENIREWPPNLPPRSADLKALIGFNADRAISPSGIELFTLRYNSPDLAALRLNLEKGERVALKYAPQDISVIYVYDRFEDRTIEVPALNQEYTRKLTIWQHHVIRKYARRAVQDCVDMEALCPTKEKIQQKKLVEQIYISFPRLNRVYSLVEHCHQHSKIAAELECLLITGRQGAGKTPVSC